MRLRTFLVKRSIHTVITLVIVLVLLFVIFRLMPGDPTRFFIRPGQTEADRIDLLVQFGFYHREPAPGNGYEVIFTTNRDGTYELSLLANDSAGRSQPFYFYHVKQGAEPGVPYVNVTTNSTEEAWDTSIGTVIPIVATLDRALPADEFNANVTVSRGGIDLAWPPVTEENAAGTAVRAPWTPTEEGPYSVTVTFEQENGTKRYTGYGGGGVNAADPSPFRLAENEWNLSTESIGAGTGAWIRINVTSQGSTISVVTVQVRPPGGQPENLTLFHPLIAVPNNILEEFWSYLTSMLRGDFGKSLYSSQPVWTEIGQRVGPSLLLFGSSVVISYALGILIGAVLAWRRGSKMELSAIVVSLFFYSMPVFWFGLILLWFFAFTLRWFPLGGFGGVDELGTPLTGIAYVGDILHHMALPLLNLVILSLAGHVLLMRNSMLEVMGEDYITTAKAKGLSERRVMYRHAARNALLPVVTAFALAISGVISGGVLTETIFSWPGMGAFLVQSTLNQDYPSVQGAFFLLAVLTIMANLVADVLYAYLDPRVRL